MDIHSVRTPVSGNGGFKTLRLVFAWAVTLLWVVSMVLYLFIPQRTIEPGLIILTGAVATALFGPSVWKRNGE